jgi:hypothetical protein
MKIDQAYSLDAKEVIDPELAYDYFWAGIIKNKRNFVCPANNCSVPITCANLDKLRDDMKVDPYFVTKRDNEHDGECDLVREIMEKEINLEIVSGNKKDRARKSENLPDIFGLSRPKSHFEKKISSPTVTPTDVSEGKTNGNKKYSSTQNPQSTTHYSVRAFVSKFLRYKSSGVFMERYVNIKGYDVSYGSMFVNIAGQDISTISKYPRIYYGKAFINIRKGKDYSVCFQESLSHEDELTRPTTYISEAQLEEAFTKKLTAEKFSEYSKKKYPCIWGFVYGIPRIRVVENKKYININISNLDYFDMRDEI